MFSRWLRLGIRTQITVMVVIGAILTTAVTLLIANVSIQGYGIDQAKAQEQRNLRVAQLLLQTEFGPSVSISSDNNLVIDSPTVSKVDYTTDPTTNAQYGKLPLNKTTTYVDQVRTLLDGVQVSVYQCANATIDPLKVTVSGHDEYCPRISTTLLSSDPSKRAVNTDTSPAYLLQNTRAQMGLFNKDNSLQIYKLIPDADGIFQPNVKTIVFEEPIGGTQYMSAYAPMTDPQGHVIGVLSVAEPLTKVTELISKTTIELIISGIIIMIAGIILALLVASTISGTLQRAATQLGAASSQLTTIANQQAGGARQQVWAINAINQALQNLQETSNDVSHRTDQLSQIGSQVAMRRAEISPAQFESVMSYMTRSVRDISVATHQQTTTVERMSSAMQAVVEIADQVAGNSQQTSESTRRLDQVVTELEELVTGRQRQETIARNNDRDRGRMGMDQNSQTPMRGGQSNGPMMGATPSRPYGGGARPGMSAPDAVAPGGARQRAGYGGMGGPEMGQPASSRPMLPSPQSRPQGRGQGGWDQGTDDGSENFPTGYGSQAPRPNRDQGRNNR